MKLIFHVMMIMLVSNLHTLPTQAAQLKKWNILYVSVEDISVDCGYADSKEVKIKLMTPN